MKTERPARFPYKDRPDYRTHIAPIIVLSGLYLMLVAPIFGSI